MTDTGEIQFGDEPTGLYLNDQDCQRFYQALYTVLSGRNDPISVETVAQLRDLLKESEEAQGQVHRLRPYRQCLAGPASADPSDI